MENATTLEQGLAGFNPRTRIHPFRVAGRSFWLIAEFALAACACLVQLAFRRNDSLRAIRARWLQRSCRRVLRVFNVTLEITGLLPVRGLVVSNHLSYLDVLVLGATAPAVFVAKREVRSWPVIGWLAQCAGTVFVLRHRRTNVARSTAELKTALDQGALVALFPEGTSSGGDIVLPFKSALLEPAARQKHPVFGCFIRYELADGSVADDVCYWRDMTLVPHVLKLLAKRGVSAHLSFTQLENPGANRKELARQLHAEVTRLKEEAVCRSL